MTITTKEMIEVMQAFEDGKPIECINYGYTPWERCYRPAWDWIHYDYRVAVTKPSWDWSHVSDEINFLVRQSPVFGGKGSGLAFRPEKGPDFWTRPFGLVVHAANFASYDPGTCDWRDSLVVRPGYKEDDQ